MSIFLDNLKKPRGQEHPKCFDPVVFLTVDSVFPGPESTLGKKIPPDISAICDFT